MAAAFINPFVEGLEYSQPIPFMFAHYVLFIAGLMVGAVYLNMNRWFVIPGVILAFYWHLPVPFALSASVLGFRILEESSFVLAGLMVGGSLARVGWKIKGTMLGLWVIADNALSVIFIVAPQLYSSSGLPLSPYTDSQFPLLGVTMILLMNSLVAVVIFVYTSRLTKELKRKRERDA